jgi:hypothetical protein
VDGPPLAADASFPLPTESFKCLGIKADFKDPAALNSNKNCHSIYYRIETKFKIPNKILILST